jgi:DNA-binding transcriptional LysR family regulator
MDLRGLRYFVAVAEERHFGRAAKRLRMAQPPLSRHVQSLEEELGFALLTRSRRRVELTPAGAVLLDHARRLFEAVELAAHEARRASAGKRGRITVGHPPSLAYSGLTALLRAFRARFPDVEIALRGLPPAEQVSALKDGTCDVGFLRAPLDDSALVWECVRREPLVVAVASDHPLARRSRVQLSALSNEPFVMFPRQRGPAFFDQLISMCRDAGFTPRIVQEAAQLDIVSLVAAGFGVAILPGSIRELQRTDLVLLPIIGAPYTELLVAWREGNASPVLREFLDVVRKVGVEKRRAR